MTTDGGELHFEPGPWSIAAAQNPPPPPITPAPVATPGSAIDDLLQVLGIASNAGIADDNLEAQTAQAEREAGINAAQTNFPANEEQSAQMFQALPQAFSAVGAAFGAGFGAALQPFTQIAQQASQAAQQGLQAGLGAMEQASSPGAELDEDILGELPGDAGGITGGWDGGPAGGSAGGESPGGTVPASPLGPPPTPSAATYPASAPATTTPAAAAPASPTGPRTPAGAVPFMPPGAAQPGGTGNEPKPDTKRVVAPSVRNGGPVQGRLTAAPPPAVTKHLQGRPVATRRVVAPDQAAGAHQDDPER